MFKHVMSYHAKTFFRDREAFFWTIAFPFIFVLIYYFALSGLAQPEAYMFDPVSVAIVEESASEEQIASFDQFLGNVGVIGTLSAQETTLQPKTSTDGKFLLYTKVGAEEAASLLDQNVVYAIVSVENPLQMTAKNASLGAGNTLNGTVLLAVLNQYQQMRATTETITEFAMEEKLQLDSTFGQSIQNALEAKMDLRQADVKWEASDTIIYFFSALGYLAIFSSLNLGIPAVANVEANQSPQAMRSSLAPYKKWKAFFATIIPLLLTNLVLIVIIYFFLRLLGLDLGPYIFPATSLLVLGSTTGFFLGTAIGSLFKAKPSVKTGLGVSVPLLLGFLSGLMAVNVRTFVRDNVPFLQKINPVSQIVEGLYNLNAYDTFHQFFGNVINLVIILVIVILLTILGLRRSSYESI